MKRHLFSTIIITAGMAIALVSLSFTGEDTQKDKLVQISNEYKTYDRFENIKVKITDTAAWNWTISLCTSMPKTSPYKTNGMTLVLDSLHMSSALPSLCRHGNKLYKLYIKDIKSYKDTSIKTQPLGQVIVKETWNVREIHKDSVSTTSAPIKQSKNDGKYYTPTVVSELFIMYKEAKGQDNDEGWVYGIVSLEDTSEPVKVLENGKISSCITCHSGTKYDRIFGRK